MCDKIPTEQNFFQITISVHSTWHCYRTSAYEVHSAIGSQNVKEDSHYCQKCIDKYLCKCYGYVNIRVWNMMMMRFICDSYHTIHAFSTFSMRSSWNLENRLFQLFISSPIYILNKINVNN